MMAPLSTAPALKSGVVIIGGSPTTTAPDAKVTAHGVRKIGATRAAENGATVAELEAIFGWQGGGMASLYTKAANRARLAKAAINKLERTVEEHSIPAPSRKVRAPI